MAAISGAWLHKKVRHPPPNTLAGLSEQDGIIRANFAKAPAAMHHHLLIVRLCSITCCHSDEGALMHRIGKASMKAYVKGTVVATVVFLSAGAAQAQNGAENGTLSRGSDRLDYGYTSPPIGPATGSSRHGYSYHANPYYHYANPTPYYYYYYADPGPWEGWKRNF
jgi:hypothetical protein